MNLRMRRGRLGLLVVCFACVAAPPATSAWRTAADTAEFDDGIPVGWASSRVTLGVYGTSSDRLPATMMFEAATSSIATWNAAPCGTANLQLLGSTASAAAPDDGQNTIEVLATGWRERGYDTEAVGTTDVAYRRAADGTWHIVEADIYLNDATQRLAFADLGAEGKDVHAVLTHEIGHVLGLLHNCELDGSGAPVCAGAAAESTMYPLYGGAAQLTLAPDDVAGFCFLYGRDCASTDDCARGECIEGSCVGCASSADCAEGDTCDARGECVPPPVIEPPQAVGRGVLGDPCGASTDCASERCLDGACAAGCEPTSVCSEGGSCTALPDGTSACALDARPFGSSCSVGEDCQSSLCLLGGGATTCTRECGAAELCPAGTRCDSVEGRRVCILPASASGCTAIGANRATTTTGTTGGLSALLFVAAYFWALNRKRR